MEKTIGKSKSIIDYAYEINKYKSKALLNLIKMGEVLWQAKSNVQHGEWLVLLKNNLVNMSTRTAQRYISLYLNMRAYVDEEHIDLGSLKDIEVSKVLKLTCLPITYMKYIPLDKADIYGKKELCLDPQKIEVFMNSIVAINDINKTPKEMTYKELGIYVDSLKKQLGKPTNRISYFKDDAIPIAYVSGFIDGEGCLQIVHKGGHEFSFSINITNTHKKTLDKIHDILSMGSIYEYKSSHAYVLVIRDFLEVQKALDMLNLFTKSNQQLIMRYAMGLYLRDPSQYFDEICRCSVALDFYNKGKDCHKLHDKNKHLYCNHIF